jgi:hypothetical protein
VHDRRYDAAALLAWGALHPLWTVPPGNEGSLFVMSGGFGVQLVFSVVIGALLALAAFERLPALVCYGVGVLELQNAISIATKHGL